MENVVKEINGNMYEISPFMGMTGWRYQLRLAKMIGPAIQEALGAIPKGKLEEIFDGEVDVSAFGGALSSFIEAVAGNDPDGEFVATLLSQTQRNGVALSKSVINTAYQGNYGEMMKALLAVVVANGFFGVSDTGLAGLKDLAAQFQANSTTDSEKNGPSGDLSLSE